MFAWSRTCLGMSSDIWVGRSDLNSLLAWIVLVRELQEMLHTTTWYLSVSSINFVYRKEARSIFGCILASPAATRLAILVAYRLYTVVEQLKLSSVCILVAHEDSLSIAVLHATIELVRLKSKQLVQVSCQLIFRHNLESPDHASHVYVENTVVHVKTVLPRAMDVGRKMYRSC